MGSFCTRASEPSPFGHLKPNNEIANTLASEELSIEEQELSSELLGIIDKNFKAGIDEWTALKKNDDDIKQSNGVYPSQITENIFIGDHRAASNVNIYDKDSFGITIVINCAGSEFLKRYPSNVKVLKICASDEVGYKIINKHIDDIIQFIDKQASNSDDKNEKILFHCLAGVNRSVTLCIAYMMYKYKESKSIIDIVDLVSKQRHIGILSNVGFVKQLVLYNSKLKEK